jgi:Domain of unknown function (DUF4111)
MDEKSASRRERLLGSPVVPELDSQLSPEEAQALRRVLFALAGEVRRVLGDALTGVYLNGSFALGAGDIHADVDFMVAARRPLTGDQERGVRDLHRRFPDRPEHWARVLEGSYVSLGVLRERADRRTPWLYVDNGAREMEWSTHDNTEVFRWVLKNRALTVVGPPAASLLGHVPIRSLREEAAATAARRRRDATEDPEYLENGWGQPHEVLACCRMLYTATTGEVTAKKTAALWCLNVLPTEWHDLLQGAVEDRPDPWTRIHRTADPERTSRTRQLIDFVAPMIAHAARRHVD